MIECISLEQQFHMFKNLILPCQACLSVDISVCHCLYLSVSECHYQSVCLSLSVPNYQSLGVYLFASGIFIFLFLGVCLTVAISVLVLVTASLSVCLCLFSGRWSSFSWYLYPSISGNLSVRLGFCLYLSVGL